METAYSNDPQTDENRVSGEPTIYRTIWPSAPNEDREGSEDG